MIDRTASHLRACAIGRGATQPEDRVEYSGELVATEGALAVPEETQ
jgi:hypothetical protein